MEEDDYCVVIIADEDFNSSKATPVVVPKDYVLKDKNHTFVRYLQPPLNDENISLVETFTKSKTPPPPSWPWFKCNITFTEST